MNKLLTLCLPLLLCGCWNVSAPMPTGDGLLELDYTAPVLDAAQSHLSYAAMAACQLGYDKISEQVIPGDMVTMKWKIKCL